MRSPIEVLQAFGQGMMSGTGSWKEVIADDITFTGPAAQTRGIEEFIQLNEGFLGMVRGNRMKQVAESGNYAITQVEIDVAMPSGKTITLDMSEWYEVKDGKIQSIKVYYDAEEFRSESAAN